MTTRIKNPTHSPCIRKCSLDINDLCLGCFRTLNEIIEWSNSDEKTKKTVVLQSRQRKSIHNN